VSRHLFRLHDPERTVPHSGARGFHLYGLPPATRLIFGKTISRTKEGLPNQDVVKRATSALGLPAESPGPKGVRFAQAPKYDGQTIGCGFGSGCFLAVLGAFRCAAGTSLSFFSEPSDLFAAKGRAYLTGHVYRELFRFRGIPYSSNASAPPLGFIRWLAHFLTGIGFWSDFFGGTNRWSPMLVLRIAKGWRT